MIPHMRMQTVVPLATIAMLLAPPLRPCRAQSGGAPAAVVDSFFRAVEQERWYDAARLTDLEALGALRDQAVRSSRTQRQYHVTPEQLMKSDPAMPRAAAEYQAKRSEVLRADFDLLAFEFANVHSADSLAALPVIDAAARWSEAKDPRYMMRRSYAENRKRCGLPDSLTATALLLPSMTYNVFGAVLRDSLAYVLYADSTVFPQEADSARPMQHSGANENPHRYMMPPSVITLRRLDGNWRIAPGDMFGGWMGSASFVCSEAKSRKSSRHDHPPH